MGKQGRKVKRNQAKAHPRLQLCPVCGLGDMLQSPVTDQIGVVKCAGCGILYDPTIKDLVRAIKEKDAKDAADVDSSEKKADDAMSKEDFESIREKYKDAILIDI